MEPGSLERREARREHAQQLAEELSEISLERGMNLREVNGKMKELMQAVAVLRGNEIELKVGETGTVRFLAGELSKAFKGIRYSLTYSETVDGQERPEATVFVDSDGGSMLMNKEGQGKELGWKPGAGGVGESDPFHKQLGGWMVDEQYKKDMEVAQSGHYDKYYASIGANRFRELRLAARMARIILSRENPQHHTTPKIESGDVGATAKERQGRVDDVVKK